MKMKTFLTALIAVTVGLSAAAFAAPISSNLDPFTTPQGVTATVGSPSVSNTVAAPESFFGGNRTVTAGLTSPTGTVQSVIGGGTSDCNRSIAGGGGCGVFWDVMFDTYLHDIIYGATSDGAFGGTGSITFLVDGAIIASQSIATGFGLYTTGLNTFIGAGSTFGYYMPDSVALDTSVYQVTVTHDVPEPGILALAGIGLCGVGIATRRKPKTA